MTTLYYAKNCRDRKNDTRHLAGDYACECSQAACDLALSRNPGKFMYYEDLPEHEDISINGISLAVGGTD